MKIFLIDAHNLIHKDSELKKKFIKNPETASNSLLELIRLFSGKYPSYKFLVIFDGYFEGVSIPHPAITTIFSGKQTADTIIKEQIKNSLTTKNIVVVSSDAEVLSYSKIYSCELYTSEEFLLLIKPIEEIRISPKEQTKNEKPNYTSKKDMEFFKNLFKG